MRPAITFPIVFTYPGVEGEQLNCAATEDEFYVLEEIDADRGRTLIFDSAGRTFKTTACEATPLPTKKATWWQRWLGWRPWQSYAATYQFEDTPQLSLEEAKELFCSLLEHDPYWWEMQLPRRGRGVQTGEEALDPLKTEIKSCTTFKQVFETLYPDELGYRSKKRKP